MRDFQRSERVGDELRDLISALLIREANDPRLTRVSVTAVAVSDCMQYAKVYWVLIAAEEPSERELRQVGRGLDRAAKFLRARLADQMKLRVVPQLSFRFDESLERGRRMESLLAGLAPEEFGSEGEDDGDASVDADTEEPAES